MTTEVAADTRAELVIDGMSCAGCASRVERTLNDLEGVDATVNYATSIATVAYDTNHVALADLLGQVERAGYGARLPDAVAPAPEGDGSRVVLAALVTAPVAALGMIGALRFEGWEWVALALATPVVAWCGAPFHRRALVALRHRTATMDTLVSLGTLAAYGWSTVVLLGGIDAETYFETAAVVTTLILLGRFLEQRAKRRSGDALRSLLELGAREATVLVGDGEAVVPVAELVPGDVFLVRPGERIATDGVVVEGRAAVDASMLTGEPLPIDVEPGTRVVGGTIDLDGRLVVRATAVGADTALARIARLVTQAQAAKAPVQRLVDRISAVFVPAVLTVSAATLGGWLVFGNSASEAFTAAVAVLIIACPCALGLATPTAILVGSGRGAQLGILIRGPEVLEHARRLTTVALDKTGTITTGEMRVVRVVVDGDDGDEVLRLVAAAEHGSEHPLARAIARHARELGVGPTAAGSFASVSGRGVEAEVDGRHVLVGRPSFLADRGIELRELLEGAVRDAETLGHTAVAAAVDGTAVTVLEVADDLKPTSRAAVSELHALGLDTLLVTGDNALAAQALADQAGIARVHAGLLPEDKIAAVRELRRSGEVVAMVGDGINDAPALAEADVGIAIGTGADVALEAADLTVVSGDPRAVVDAILLSRRTLATIRSNLFWAFAYNVAAIPLAVAGLLDPVIAAAAMAFSSLFVVTNSLRLRRFRSVRT